MRMRNGSRNRNLSGFSPLRVIMYTLPFSVMLCKYMAAKFAFTFSGIGWRESAEYLVLSFSLALRLLIRLRIKVVEFTRFRD